MSFFDYFSPDGEYTVPKAALKQCAFDDEYYPETEMGHDKQFCNWVHFENIDKYVNNFTDLTPEEREEIKTDLLNQFK